MHDLKWLGIRWSEGPDKNGGAYGPYKQSERLGIYKEKVNELIKHGKAYPCFCSEEELKVRREEQSKKNLPPRYDNRCRNLTSEQIAEFKKKKIEPSIRFKVDGTEVIINDLIRGEVRFDLNLIGDFVIVRASGMPTFHLSVCVDDGLMQITHVLRGEDHLSNTPRHILLFQALGFSVPQFGHMSLLKGPEGEPLSKRFGAVSIAEYRQLGYLPEALVNYMALLGWSPGDNRELLTPQELEKEFSLERVIKSPAIFDPKKLDWVSGQHLRKLSVKDFVQKCSDYVKNYELVSEAELTQKKEWFEKIFISMQDNITHFGELKDRLSMFVAPEIYEDPALLQVESSQKVLEGMKEVLGSLQAWTEANYDESVENLKKKVSAKGKALFMPIRLALTGRVHGPEMKKIVGIIGKEESIKRFDKALQFSKIR
jgi:glutamyl-tRNA synthetase